MRIIFGSPEALEILRRDKEIEREYKRARKAAKEKRDLTYRQMRFWPAYAYNVEMKGEAQCAPK